MRRRERGSAELEALDPLTGETIPTSSGTATIDLDRRGERARRRQLSRALATIAVAFALAAVYFGASIAQLRGVEGTWRSAMALDAARADADRQVRSTARAATADDDDDASLRALADIGTEVAGELRRRERALADRRIFDSKVSDLRDAMVEALQFRRSQLVPTRNRMGDTPLVLVEGQVAGQLDRWGLSPSRVDVPEVTALSPALEQLRRYADVATGATLFALDGTTLHTLDVDGSTRRQRRLPAAGKLVPTSGGVAVIAEGQLTIYPPDPTAEPLTTITDDVRQAVAAGDGSGDLWVVQGATSTVRRLRVDVGAADWVSEPLPLPPDRIVVGATSAELVLESRDGGLTLWSPATRSVAATLSSKGARFLDASGSLVLFQGPLPFSSDGGSDFLHRYYVGTSRSDLIGLPRTDAASAALGPEGIAAVAAGPLAGRLGSMLVLEPGSRSLTGSRSGPRASVEPGSIAWAHDGRVLFWLTPDGAIGIDYGTRPMTRRLLRTGLKGLDRLAIMGR